MKQTLSRQMPRKRIILSLSAALAALPLIVHPVAADARAGGGMSMGSRGSRTYSAPPRTATAPYGATPFQQTMTPRSSPSAPYGMATRMPYGAGAAAMMGRPRHPFLSGFAGGLLGAGLFGMVFGHGMFGGGGMGGSGILGLLIQLLLVFFVVRWLIRRFTGQGGMPSGLPGLRGGNVSSAAQPMNNAPAPQVALTAADYQAFQQALVNVQTAWSQQNLGALQHMATPEMVSYFSHQLTDLASRGARNVVSDVRFENGDLTESWQENGMDYATVAMRYSLIDMTTDMTGHVIDGSSTERTVVTELWTFERSSRGGTWLVSAIQQVAR
ncbi:Tim44 domain-containing protein [Novacetimonas hansenii]|uniref:Tim44 domain-containing protein n=1 Tax=Novacetimonas hansenii TaxID=436 RepID=UPI0017823FE3|nr:Tim44-like domain-containing protein [Novacetimonas hansenii]MBL7237386.1 Tim44 domain-containing protein [Novacetimonas hansenii]QOF94665.1 Tim44 domain-containing protein [Novacetimonas hansenii]